MRSRTGNRGTCPAGCKLVSRDVIEVPHERAAVMRAAARRAVSEQTRTP